MFAKGGRLKNIGFKNMVIACLAVGLSLSATNVLSACLPGEFSQKRLAVTGMPFLNPHQAVQGELFGADVRLPQLIAAEINGRQRHIALDYGHLNFRTLSFPRSMFTNHFQNSAIPWGDIQLPSADFVLTGVIENLGASSDSTLPRLERYMRRSFALADRRFNQPRRIALVFEVFDLSSGELVMQKRYVSSANWDLPNHQRVGIDSPRFWHSEFGHQVILLLDEAIEEIEQSIGCTATTG